MSKREKDYTDSETNCKGCMGPCGECEVEFTKKVKEAFKYPDLKPNFLDQFVVNYRGYSFDPDKYTKKESEDGTITLKPKKKVKVWITTWLNEYRDIEILKSFDENHYTLLLESKQKMNWTLIETIEREYEL